MKSAPRILSAALAIAAAVAIPFAQPAQPAEAAGTIDLRVMFVDWDSHYVEPGIKRARFYVAHLGTAPSVTLLAYRECTYPTLSSNGQTGEKKLMVGTPVPMSLSAGEAKIVTVDCHRDNGVAPNTVRLSATAGAGTDANPADNQYTQMFPYPFGSQ